MLRALVAWQIEPRAGDLCQLKVTKEKNHDKRHHTLPDMDHFVRRGARASDYAEWNANILFFLRCSFLLWFPLKWRKLSIALDHNNHMKCRPLILWLQSNVRLLSWGGHGNTETKQTWFVRSRNFLQLILKPVPMASQHKNSQFSCLSQDGAADQNLSSWHGPWIICILKYIHCWKERANEF